MTEEHACCQESSCPAPPREDRRLVVKIMAGAVGALAGLVPAVAGLITFVDPATRRERKFSDPKKPAGHKTDDGFIRAVALADVPTDGTPLRVALRDDVTNKWTFAPNEPIGEVLLRRESPQAEVTALTTVCPHAGCAVSLTKDADGKPIFKCPCHNSAFEIDGRRKPPTPSPRDMDSVETRVENGVVYVKYENYFTGREDKKAKH
jgi:Rieske Fe-S protein